MVRAMATLGTRDLAALRWVGEQYICRLDHLAVLLGHLGGRPPLAPPATRTVVARWVAEGLAKTERLEPRQPAWVWLTRAGLRRAGLAYRSWEPTLWVLAHMSAVNRVRLFVEPRRPGARWVPERELRALRGLQAQGADPVPDAEMHDAGGNVIAVEVELTPKTTDRRRRTMLALVARYEAVWYFAAADAWHAVHDAACHVPPELTDLVRIYALEDT